MKGAYIGAGGVRKLSKCYIGNSGVRKAKDIYVGINGAVKKVWSATVPAGQRVFTSSQVWTVPEGVKTIDVFCVGGGGGGGGFNGGYHVYSYGGGGSGYTKTAIGVTVSPGQQISVVIGEGTSSIPPQNTDKETCPRGGSTSFGTICVALGGYSGPPWSTIVHPKFVTQGGSGGAHGKSAYSPYCLITESFIAEAGGSDGGSGEGNTTLNGQGTTTRAFGEKGNTLYAGGGGAGCGTAVERAGTGYRLKQFGTNQYLKTMAGQGGGGGGGKGGDFIFDNMNMITVIPGASGEPNTGGGGGAMGCIFNYSDSSYDSSMGLTYYPGISPVNGKGGSGLCIVRWAEQ